MNVSVRLLTTHLSESHPAHRPCFPKKSFQGTGRETSPDRILLVVSCYGEEEGRRLIAFKVLHGYERVDADTEGENTEITPLP